MRPLLSLLIALPLVALAGPGDRACCEQDIRSGTPFTLTGTVDDFDFGGDLELIDENGVEHEIECVGPARYWRARGFERPAVGDTVTVEGYRVQCESGDDDPDYVASRLTLDGQTIELRDESGMPRWAGRGQQGQPGQGAE